MAALANLLHPLSLSLKIYLGSRPDSPENRLFRAIRPMKFKIRALSREILNPVEGNRTKGSSSTR